MVKAKLFMWDNLGLWLGHIEPSSFHQHHAFQLNASGDSNCEYRLSEDQTFVAHPTFLINGNVRHQVRLAARRGIILYIEPYSKIGRLLQHTYFARQDSVSPIPPLMIPDTTTLLNMLNSLKDAEEFTYHLISKLITIPVHPEKLDDRIVTLLHYIQSHLSVPLSIDILAAQAHLSNSRLMHLFKEEVGVPIRRYVLWRRLIQAHYEIMQQRSLTEAAHLTGFADSAHMTRTFRAMMGHSPSAIFSSFVQAFFDIPCKDTES